jgi:hypothetical protein
MIPNSFIYEYKWALSKDKIHLYKSDYKSIILMINDIFYLFKSNNKDFSDDEIKNIYIKEQIYINVKKWKVSHNFLDDYRKLKKNWDYFEIEKKNLFFESEWKIIKILDKIFIWNCLDIWCGDSLYKNIFNKKTVNYLWIDIHKVDNWLNIIETSFEDFNTNQKFDVLFFFRSINHFSNTSRILEKALSLLNSNWKIFIVENEAFWEIKFKEQIFEWKDSDFEHYFNYSLWEFKKLVNNNYFNIIEEDNVTKDKANQWYILLEKK